MTGRDSTDTAQWLAAKTMSATGALPGLSARTLAAIDRGTARLLADHPPPAPPALTAAWIGNLRSDDRLAAYLGLRAEPKGGPRPVVALPNGETGWCMTPGRPDGCFPPAIATVLQCDVDEVPDGRVDERRARGEAPDGQIVEDTWAALYAWLDRRGLGVVIHDEPPVELERWIAVVTMPLALVNDVFGLGLDGASLPRGRAAVAAMREAARDNDELAREVEDAIAFRMHSVVMCRDGVYHDPAIGIPAPPGQRHCPWTVEDTVFGVEIKQREE